MTLGERRIGLLFAVFVFLLAAAGARAAWLGTIESGKLKRVANGQQVQELPVPAPRGTVFDRHGVALAVSEPADDVAATPYLLKDPARAAAQLSPLLGQSYEIVLAKLIRRDTGFVYLARALAADKAASIARLKLPGLQLIPTSRRVYPHDWLASQVLGSVGVDGEGLSGLEYADDRILHGRNGLQRITRDAIGQPIAVSDAVEAKAGTSLRLTLDSTLQDRVENVLGEVGQVYRPKGATAILMNPQTGDILALANWPRVNANDPGAAPAYAREDRAVQATYEPGSTFKPFTIGGALQDGTVDPESSFYVPDQIQVADRTIHNAEPGSATLTVSQILAQSNNVGTIKIGQMVGARRFSQWVDHYGFGKPTGVDLPGEQQGVVLPLKHYSGSSMGNLPIGMGISVTPIQMAAEYAAIANGGILRPPRIVEAVGGHATRLRPGRRIMSSGVAAELRTMLEGVLAPGGTASEVSIPGYQLAGKTGTANKVDAKTGTYSDTRYVASFIGFAPARDPKLLCAVMVDEPQGAIYGGTVAAPAFGQIMAFALPYLGIAPH